jgi:YidC/Oxa1 family membrane protein insertase
MDFIAASAELNWIGRIIYNGLFLGWIDQWGITGVVGSFAVTVIFFTLFLKLITLPLDLWGKQMGRKNAKKMEIMKPELDRLQAKFEGDKQTLMAKQREVHKRYKYSMFSACLPQLVTMVIFFIVFPAFNSTVRFHNYQVFNELSRAYYEAFEQVIYDAGDTDDFSHEQLIALRDEAVAAAHAAVVEEYETHRQRFLLTKNIFMPDNWSDPVPDAQVYAGGGLGRLNIALPEGGETDYNRIMEPLFELHNTGWNGYLILPIAALLLQIVSMKFMKPPEQPQMLGQSKEKADASKKQQKMMQYLMPLIFGGMTLFFSTAFALYMFMNSVFTTITGLLFNLITKKIDAREKAHQNVIITRR